MLEIGSTVPDVAWEDTTGQVVRLSEFRGTASVLIYFMRSTTCPVCAGHVKDLAARSEELAAAGVRVLVAVPECRVEAKAWRAKRGLSLRVVSGGDGTPHEAFGLAKKMLQQSGSVLIDRDGVVRYAHAATMPTSAYDKKGIAKAVEELARVR
ncbi:Peroxiredoxin [Amycolatopsis lurida]|uniref:Peroxiredoxin n=1 Tax=Amycolatopsis lurida NRRL 2430 TaxID=1460371 RepID=A0A2P2FJ54_AMYLU|nr:redoxin domain-containing protein [Amycolatopsis lurida]KFU76745.1 peroxiredoxin [Amycolatopsis lurida NRRL 2430]SEB38313.1 Peroxiredoxin [Amycolatopsis lurida]